MAGLFDISNLPLSSQNNGNTSVTGTPLNADSDILAQSLSFLQQFRGPINKSKTSAINAADYIKYREQDAEHNAAIRDAVGDDPLGQEIYKDEVNSVYGKLDMRGYDPSKNWQSSKFQLATEKFNQKVSNAAEKFNKWNNGLSAEDAQTAQMFTKTANFMTNSSLMGPKVETDKTNNAVNGVFSVTNKAPGMIGMLSQVGQATWNMANQLSGQTMRNLQIDQNGIATSGSDYGGSLSNIQNTINQYSGKTLSGLTGEARKGKSALNKAESMVGNIYAVNANTEKRNNIAFGGLDLAMENRKLALQGVNHLNGVFAAKQGGKLEIIETPVWEFIEPELEEEIEMFKEGGSIVVDGALHARKHNIELDNITKKGVPVISEENGEIIQQAEVEGGEIVFSKSITEELEKQYNVYYNEESKPKEKNEACLKIGKLLVNEILNNTTDNTGLI